MNNFAKPGLLSILACMALALAACQREEPQAPTDLETKKSAVVYGDDNRMDYYEPEAALWRDRVSSSVVALVRPDRINTDDPDNILIEGARLQDSLSLCDGERFLDQLRGASCSGTLIDDDLVLTAGHCIDDQSECDNRRLVFGYYETSPGQVGTITSDDVYECAEIVTTVNRGDLDYAIVRLDRPVGENRLPAPVKRTDEAMLAGDGVTLIGFPNGIPAKVSPSGMVVTPREDSLDFFEATVDAFGGNSGSGVYNEDGEVVGILVRGERDYITRGPCQVVNVLNDTRTEEEGAEDITYVARAIEDLCAKGLDSERLCGGDDRQLCFSCEEDSQCRGDWTCQRSGVEEAISFCSPSCDTDEDCRADHTCAGGQCAPREEERCDQGDLWSFDSCGRRTALVEECADGELCLNGSCAERGEGDVCNDAVTINPVSQRITGDLATSFGADARGNCGGNGPERIFQFVLAEETLMRAAAQGGDPVLYLRADCESPGSEIACNDDSDQVGNRGSYLEETLLPGTYFLFMDSYELGTRFILNVQFGQICDDECIPGVTRCEGDSIEVCQAPAEGEDCPTWVVQEACEEGTFCEQADDEEATCAERPAGDTCDTAVELEAVDQMIEGDLRAGATNSTRGTCAGNGPELVYTFTLEEARQVEAIITGLDSVIYMRQDCLDDTLEGQIACNDDSDPPGDFGSRIRPILEPGTYFVFVDVFNDDRAEAFNLSLSFLEPCGDECIEGGVRCADGDAQVVEACTYNNFGCTQWTALETCDRTFACQEGACESACEDECALEEKRCDDEGFVQSCRSAEENFGCNTWSAPIACSPGEVCQGEGDCVEAPDEPDMGADMGTDMGGDDADMGTEDEEGADAGNNVTSKKNDGCQSVPGGHSGHQAWWLVLAGLVFGLRTRRQPRA